MGWDSAGLRRDGDLRAQLEELGAGYLEGLVLLRQLQAQAGRVTAVARSRDGLVSVEVGARGQLLDLMLGPGVYEHLPPQRLAAVVVELAAAAAADAAGQVRQIMAAMLPGGDVAGLVPSGLSLLDGGVAGRW